MITFYRQQRTECCLLLQREGCYTSRGKWLNWLHSILGWFSTDFRKLKILSQHLLPQSRVRDFLGKQVSQQPRYNAGLIPHGRTCPWAWVLPAETRTHWLFQVGAGLHFPHVEQFPILISSMCIFDTKTDGIPNL